MRLLKAVKGNDRPHIRFYVDTESAKQTMEDSDKELHTFKLGSVWVVHEKGSADITKTCYELWKPEDLFSVIDKYVSAKTKGFVFAHNYQFDALTLRLFPQLRDNGWTIERWVIESDMFILTAKKDNKKLAFIDSFNYFKTSIKAMGKQIGISKLEANFDNMENSELMKYCINDSKILMEFMEQFISWWNKNDYGNFRNTLAGLSLEAYRHKFLDYDIWLHDITEARMLELKGYKGGRVEALFIGKPRSNKFFKLDINSQYPFVMQEFTYPVALVEYVKYPTPVQLAEALAKHLVIADVTFKDWDNAIAYKADRLYFPIGTMRETLTTPELRYLVAKGVVKHVHSMAYYRHAPIFKSFVKHFYEQRMQFRADNNYIYDLFAKLLMNSLYGKFGQQNTQYKCLGDSELNYNCTRFVLNRELHTRTMEIHLNGKVYVAEGIAFAPNAFIAIAAHVTAYARMLLWRYMKEAGDKHLYYVDTDSLIVDELGYSNLQKDINNTQLGKLKLEAESKFLHIRNAKDYTFGAEVKRKGIRKDAEQLNSFRFRQIKFSKIRSMLAKGIDDAVYIEKIEKQLNKTYHKGTVQADGWVKPFLMGKQLPQV